MLLRTLHQISKLVQECHKRAIGRNSGVLKTYRCLAVELYWVGMKKDIKEMVMRCNGCQGHKDMAMTPRGLLQLLSLSDKI